jgi:sorbitol-specific phosphotransferase system component IIBC
VSSTYEIFARVSSAWTSLPIIQHIVEDALVSAIKSAMMNLLTISDGLVYHKLKCSRLTKSDEPTCLTYKHGRLHVLHNCYVEVFIGLICSVRPPQLEQFFWILQISPLQRS